MKCYDKLRRENMHRRTTQELYDQLEWQMEEAKRVKAEAKRVKEDGTDIVVAIPSYTLMQV